MKLNEKSFCSSCGNAVQTPPDWRSVYVPRSPTPVTVRYTYILWALYGYTRESSWNADSNTLEFDHPRHDRPTAYVIAQQYFSRTFVSLRFLSRKETFSAFQKYRSFLLFLLNHVSLKFRDWKLRQSGSVCSFEYFLDSWGRRWRRSLSICYRWMLWIHEEEHDSGRMVVGMVVCHGRSEVVTRGDDFESHVRERWDSPWRSIDGYRRGPVQDHEGRGAAADGFWTVPWEERQGGEVHRVADPGGAPQGHPRSVPVLLLYVWLSGGVTIVDCEGFMKASVQIVVEWVMTLRSVHEY